MAKEQKKNILIKESNDIMKRKRIIIQFNENGILLLKDNKLTKHKTKSVNNYKVVNKTKFYDDFKKVIDSKKINNNIFTDNIIVLIDKTYTELDIETITILLKELSFNKIIFKNINDFFSNEEINIQIDNNIFKIYYGNKIVESKLYFEKNIEIIALYLKEIIKDCKYKRVKLYGSHKNMKSIMEDLEKKIKVEMFMYSYPEYIPISTINE